jgi:excisionase family DNA binding protein
MSAVRLAKQHRLLTWMGNWIERSNCRIDWLGPKILHQLREKMIMTLQAGEKLMSLTDVSEMLGIPVHTLYRWRHNGDGPAGYRVGRHVRYRREAVEAWLERQADKRS